MDGPQPSLNMQKKSGEIILHSKEFSCFHVFCFHGGFQQIKGGLANKRCSSSKIFKAEILQIFELVIWKIDDFLNSFWIYLTFREFVQSSQNIQTLRHCSVVQTIFRDKIFFTKNLELMEWSLFLWFHRREQHFIALVYCTQVSIYWEILLAVSKLRSKVGKKFLGLAWEKVRSIFKWHSNTFEIHILDLWM